MKCINCGKAWSTHCKKCDACYNGEAGHRNTCPKDPDNKRESGGRRR